MMTNKEKIQLYKSLNRGYGEDFILAMDKAGDTVCNYYDYLSDTDNGINCDKELRRLPNADYKLCCVLLTMLLREDHFDNGSFEERYRKGQVQPILDRMIAMLEAEDRGIIKILIKGYSGFGSYEEAYEDQITIMPDAIAYKLCWASPGRQNDGIRWRYESNSSAFSVWFQNVCKGVEGQLNSAFDVFCTDVGGVDFTVVYEDKTKRHQYYETSTDYFGDLFRLIKQMVPAGELVPFVLKTSEDYRDSYEIEAGRYRHFKGKEYEVLSTAKNSETEQEMVVYKALYGDGGIWVRPAAMWDENIYRDGKFCRRFTKIDDK